MVGTLAHYSKVQARLQTRSIHSETNFEIGTQAFIIFSRCQNMQNKTILKRKSFLMTLTLYSLKNFSLKSRLSLFDCVQSDKLNARHLFDKRRCLSADGFWNSPGSLVIQNHRPNAVLFYQDSKIFKVQTKKGIF